MFIEKALAHIPDHHRITVLLVGSFRSLFEKADLINAVSLLNPYFGPIFESIFTLFYREDIIKNNILSVPTIAIHEICEKCDI